ncbi:MAG: translation initiation factor IF-3 [Chloroflexia bacterium]|nr:translation initiation factor IF-3 [Chloroflexia bacterium]
MSISSRPVRVNERIRIREVRLIDEDGKQIGVIATRDALETARQRGLDLVEVQPNAVPPVCRLMDYGRFRYEESRKERESRKRAKTVALKEIRMKPKIGEHDVETKARNARRFLTAGDRVKVSVRFRGRENLHPEIGRDLLLKMITQLEDIAIIDQQPRSEGQDMSILLSPKISKEEMAESDETQESDEPEESDES